MSHETLKRCFAPVVDERTRVLVLGSLPGEESLARGQYYANPRNQFWRLIGAVIGRDLVSLDYEPRLMAVLEARIGLWDTVASASRKGSLDTAIRLHEASNIKELADNFPSLSAVAFNGGKSAALGRKLLADRPGLTLIDLPSSSPALTWPFDRKLAEWMKLRTYL